MIKIKWFKGLLVQKIPLIIIAVILAIGLSLVQQSLTLPFLLKDSSPATSALTFFGSAFADHGQETTLTLYNSSFGSLTSGGGNQISVFASYKVNDNSISGQTINAVMEVYAPNGTLIRTSSYPDGFIAQGSGGVEGLETTIKDSTLQSITANVTFRDLNKTEVLSNDLKVNLNLAEQGPTSATAGEDAATEAGPLAGESEQEQEQDSSPLQQPDQEGDVEDTLEEGGGDSNEDEDQGEQPTLPLPLFGE
jgi:hypothetical protein